MAVLAAVAVRFLTPVGWMPNPNAHGADVIIICTGDGPLLLHGADPPGNAPAHGASHEHCLFAGFALFGGRTASFIPARLQVRADTHKPALRRVLWRSREDYRLQAPRGPPEEV